MESGRILDDYFVPYRENDQYTEATELTVNAVVSVVADEYDVQIQGVDENLTIESEEEESEGLPLWIIILIIALIIGIAIFVAIVGDDSSGGSSGGYYGGSSGGFSGGSFGGGFSGGGGASR